MCDSFTKSASTLLLSLYSKLGGGTNVSEAHRLVEAWLKACVKEGLSPSSTQAFNQASVSLCDESVTHLALSDAPV